MYYGIAGGAKVYVDCKVDYQEIDTWEPLSSFKIAMQQEWTLTTHYEDTVVKVMGRAVNNCDRRVVISALLAGLRQITDSEIYDASVAAIETRLGFMVDRWIPAGIGEITDTVIWGDRIEYEVYISETIGSYQISIPVIDAQYLPDTGIVRVMMKIEVDGKSLKSCVEFDSELWGHNEYECVRFAQEQMLHSLYEKIPHRSTAVSALRYIAFEEKMKNPSSESVHKILADTPTWLPVEAFFNNAANPPNPYGYIKGSSGGEDRRVKELPALKEKVKHPVTQQTMTLKSAIISLNDGHKWTREQIADWLETLDVDISFKVDNEQD